MVHFVELLLSPLNPASSAPLYEQLYSALREAILEGRLRPGLKLPDSTPT